MKKLTSLLLVLTMLCLVPSCKKYEDDPLISLRTKKGKLAGTWKLIETVKKDGTVKPYVNTVDPDYIETFERNGDYVYDNNPSYTYSPLKWEFVEDGNIRIYDTNGNTTSPAGSFIYQIKKLTNKEFWYYVEQPATGYYLEYHMEAQ